MILINGNPVEINHFPDGSPRINIDVAAIEVGEYNGMDFITIDWLYRGNDDEIFYLFLVKKHLDKYFANVNYYLCMPYIPNARMDRIKQHNEVFTLKYFCDFINSLNFDAVYVLDAHSDVSVALLNNCICTTPKGCLEQIISELPDDLIFYFPDAGAAKRYSDLFPHIPYCYGEKRRDWSTGKILGLDVKNNGIDLTGKTIMMIDDIISYGGSLYYSAKALKELGAGTIYAYATHTENSILDTEKGTLIKLIEDGTVEKLFTTNSILSETHDKFTILGV